MITTAEGFGGSLFCALALLTCLFTNVNRSLLWGRTMWYSAAGYGITAFLFAFNPYTIQELYPIKAFVGISSGMLGMVAISYILNASAKLLSANGVERELLLEGRRVTYRMVGFGIGWITIGVGIILLYGVAEQSTTAPNIGKQLARIEHNQNVSEQRAQQRYDELIKNGQGRDKRLDKLEAADRLKAQRDNTLFASLAAGQRYIINLFRSTNKPKPERPVLITIPQARSLPSTQFVMPGTEQVKPVAPVNKRGKKISFAPAPWQPDTTELARLMSIYYPY